MTSSPANRTTWREEENRSFLAQPARHRQRGDRPDPVQPRGQHLRAGQVPGRVQQLMPQLVQPGLQRGRSRPGRWRPGTRPAGTGTRPRPSACPRPGPGRPGGTAPRGSAAPRRCARPAGHGRSPAAPGTPGCGRAGSSTPAGLGQQHPQVPAVGLIGLGVPLATTGERGIGRLGQMRRDPGRGQLLHDVPPPRAPLDRERDILQAAEPGQPGAQALPVSRGDLAALHLPGHGVEVVEGDLLPVDIQPAYDGHRDLLELQVRAHAPHANCLRGQS